MFDYDITILTDSRFVNPRVNDDIIRNVLLEDGMAMDALKRKGLKVVRKSWDDKEFDWSQTRYAIFKTTWNYFDRFAEFSEWMESASKLTKFINPIETIRWNIDKHYLAELQSKGVNVPKTLFIETGDKRTLKEIYETAGWPDCILKPAVSGAARHTYKLNRENITEFENIFSELISYEPMMLQEYQYSITEKGEYTYVVFGGKFSHAVLKRAKDGDFRVQDDHGGTVHEYNASDEEIEFAESVVAIVNPLPAYGRVDAIIDNEGRLAVSELELIEPELWFRFKPESADDYADAVLAEIRRIEKAG